MNSAVFDNVVERLKEEEGFRAKPYDDHLGKLTIGYGTLIEDGISEEEAGYLLRSRLLKIQNELLDSEPYVIDLNEAVQEILMDMAYNLGVPRLMGFKKMWEAIADKDWERAAIEILDSVYAGQVPYRAQRNAEKMRAV